jgi:V/A-type H+-transporting ATPase subunit D
MAKLNIAPTKSNFLALKRQLAFAEEGYDLLEQKRQILILELMSRLARAGEVEDQVATALRRARSALREATLDIGSLALERAVAGLPPDAGLKLTDQRLMGLSLPHLTFQAVRAGAPFGIIGTSVNTDLARRRFGDLLPLLAELAELQNAVLRLARELRKTQRRCNALSKIFIPAYRETIRYISGTLEERERESLTILKIVQRRLVHIDGDKSRPRLDF